jgi:hypothetical protein
MSVANGIAVRIQAMTRSNQVLTLARLAQHRSGRGEFASQDIESLYDYIALPKPHRVRDLLVSLQTAGLVTSAPARGLWRLTPRGSEAALDLVNDLDLRVLLTQTSHESGSFLGHTIHPVVDPFLAPPELLIPIREFLNAHPFESNVFAMTRFPDDGETLDAVIDPLIPSIAAARSACTAHGFELHLASDRLLVDDLWANVSAHMWSCRYGIAFFEDRRARGVNYNLTIEVGGMLLSGRRTALLKDVTVPSLPSDLVGKIYKSVDLDQPSTVESVLHQWLRDDLGSPPCKLCTTVLAPA